MHDEIALNVGKCRTNKTPNGYVDYFWDMLGDIIVITAQAQVQPVVKRGKGAPARHSPGQVPRQKGPLTKPCNGERVRAIGGKAPHEADHDEVSLAHPRTDLKPSNAVDTYCWTPVEDTRCGHLLLDTRCGHLLFDTR